MKIIAIRKYLNKIVKIEKNKKMSQFLISLKTENKSVLIK